MNLFSLGSERRISSFAFVTLILTAEWIFIKVVKFEEYAASNGELTDDISQTEIEKSRPKITFQSIAVFLQRPQNCS